MKLLYAAPDGERPPLFAFMDTLETKLQQKLHQQFELLTQSSALPREPLVKHFTIAKYSELYELRAKNKILVRIIFTVQDENIILLTPFIKKHTRNTMQALDASLKLLARIDNGTCSVTEMFINQKVEESE